MHWRHWLQQTGESYYGCFGYSTTITRFCRLLQKAVAKLALAGEEPLVSSDYRGDPRSSIIDGPSTLVIGGRLVKILAWYDNEWGFSNRLVDLALLMEMRGL